MSAQEESDELEASSHTLNDLLADLNVAVASSSGSRFPAPQAPSWLPSSSSTRSSPSFYTARPSSLLPRRASSRDPVGSVSGSDLSPAASSFQPAGIFHTPNRSIFSSGPPTSSISASTAQASMSPPPSANTSHPLSALTGPGISNPRRHVTYQVEASSSTGRIGHTAEVEKEVDDPSGNMDESASNARTRHGTSATLTQLFASSDVSSRPVSRQNSYLRTANGAQYTRAKTNETAPLPSHLYTKGLLSGRHSDITVHAFGTGYALHRLLLDRAPFFSSALSEPWFESSAKEITLHPEDVDSHITRAAFELALKRIYGCHSVDEEDQEAVGLFAVGCWLEMADLIEASIASIIRQMSPARLSLYIRFVTGNYYGKAGDRILASAKAMLCRDGWKMPIRCYDGISGDIVREIIGSDGFYIPGEWERWVLTKRLVNRRLKALAAETGLVDSDGSVRRAPHQMSFMAIRFDTVYRKTSAIGARDGLERDDPWLAIYTHADIAPLLVLLDEGIHYVHLSFEQMQRIREQRDVFGLPLMPEKVVSAALWMSMELRQRIVNAKELELELGLSQQVEDADLESIDTAEEEGPQSQAHLDRSPSDSASGKQAKTSSGGIPRGLLSGKAAGRQIGQEDNEAEDDQVVSDSWDGNGKPRKFWIPQTDATYPMGDNLEEYNASYVGPVPRSQHTSRLSASIEPQDVQWATDFASAAQDRPETPGSIATVSTVPSPQISYTHYPPFRFAAEFPNVRCLKENKRVYSSTIWYAGSFWNVYVQKKETSKHTQLGVYLHRERQVEANDELIAKYMRNSVDERIGHLERELLVRRAGGMRNRAESRGYATDELMGSGTDMDPTLVDTADLDTLSGMLQGRTNSGVKASEARLANASGSSDSEEDETSPKPKIGYPAMPPYVDGRPTIRTYFKIYTPSKGGRVLTAYESKPDKFNFSQSWGWKSSSLVLEDGTEGQEGKGKLRFMIVIGVV